MEPTDERNHAYADHDADEHADDERMMPMQMPMMGMPMMMMACKMTCTMTATGMTCEMTPMDPAMKDMFMGLLPAHDDHDEFRHADDDDVRRHDDDGLDGAKDGKGLSASLHLRNKRPASPAFFYAAMAR